MRCRVAALLVLASLPLTREAEARIEFGQNGLTAEAGPITVRGRFAVAVQGAVFQPTGDTVAELGGEVDGSALLSAEYESRRGFLFGVRAEIDTGNEDIGGFERDEIFGYFVSNWGRLELGENDGAADTLSFHAPTIGLGQVRGDFARFTGSIALLSPFDSRDAFKASYFSPPVSGFRFGVSYAPRFALNQDDPDLDDQTLQRNVVEFGANYVRPVGRWVVGGSGSFVYGDSDPLTEREDIVSWSVGAEASRRRLTLGAAYVDRGRSNLRATSDRETEWNIGLAWTAQRWRLASSYAVTLEGDERDHRLGAGVEVDLIRNLYFRVDAVGLLQQERGDPNEFGFVALSEVGVRF